MKEKPEQPENNFIKKKSKFVKCLTDIAILRHSFHIFDESAQQDGLRDRCV
jgi:hypothetical protein